MFMDLCLLQKKAWVAKFIKHALAGEDVEIYGDGLQSRDFIFIDDISSAIVDVINKSDIGGNVFQIATSKNTAVINMVTILLSILAGKGIKDINVLHSEPKAGEIRHTSSDTAFTQNTLQWNASISLESGLKSTIDWFLQQEKVKYVNS